jgi:hypothetical protein
MGVNSTGALFDGLIHSREVATLNRAAPGGTQPLNCCEADIAKPVLLSTLI